MSWDMLSDDAAALERVQAEWLEVQFQYEYCDECGGDADDHVAGPDPLGNMHAYCKPIEVGTKVKFEGPDEVWITGKVVASTGKPQVVRVQIIPDGDADTSHWVIAELVQRSQPA